jgi:RNA polymerase sigma-70 factor (ECF subfamily)
MRRNREAKEIRDGDTDAFDRLFDQYAPRVLVYLLRLTGSRTEAEDLTQETFLAAFAGRDGYRGRSHPLTWLLGIARRRWRDGRRHPGPCLEPLREAFAVTDDHADRVALAATLAAALDRLDEGEREVLLLTAVQGLSYAEAAKILGEPAGTLRWRVYEATRKLRRLLNAAEERYEAQQERNARQPARADRPSGRG